MLNERGVKPEALPASVDLKKLSRKIESDGRKAVKGGKKNEVLAT